MKLNILGVNENEKWLVEKIRFDNQSMDYLFCLWSQNPGSSHRRQSSGKAGDGFKYDLLQLN